MRMKINQQLFLLCFCISRICIAQQLYFSGKILFERKENIHKQLTGNSSWEEEYKKRVPKYRIDEMELIFNKDKSLYKVSKNDETPVFMNFKIASNNIVYNNFVSNQTINIKEIFDEVLIIEDSIPQLKWRYHGDYRKIAGFNCRKASTIINDSLYVIAFYTDEIPVPAGPESLNGLPGMILGYVIPRLHTTCFATKVTTMFPGNSEFEINKVKGKKFTRQTFLEYIFNATKNWGGYANQVIFKVLI